MIRDEWKAWDQAGLFPGEEETEEAFTQRAKFCMTGPLIDHEEGFLEYQHLKNPGVALAHELYGIAPHWVPILFSNHQLMPWHGGCTWIFQETAENPPSAFIQLRASFLTKDRLWGLYRRDEIIAHEMAHVGRMAYVSGNQYEELLAYQALSCSWRRFFGPMIQSSWEALLFLCSLGVALFIQILPFWLGEELSSWTWWSATFFPCLLFLLAIGRVVYRQRILKRAHQHLQGLLGSNQKARHLLYRLTDWEVRLFSRESPEGIVSWIQKQKTDVFRWRFFLFTREI